MSGFHMADCRTNGMAPSEIRDAIQSRKISLCPYRNLSGSDTDVILDGFLQRTRSPDPATRRCMSVMALGTNRSGIPVARIQTNCSDGRIMISTPAVCTYCPRCGDICDDTMKFDIYEIIQDDPEFNSDLLEAVLGIG